MVRKLGLVFGFLVLLGGCSQDLENWTKDDRRPQPLPTPVVIAHTIHYDNGTIDLSQTERRSLAAFLNRTNVTRRDRLALVASSGDQITGQADTRIRAVRRLLEPFALRFVEAAPWQGGDPAVAGTVRLEVHRTLITLPGCPDWTGDPTDTRDNLHSSNFGCASATNLGLMLARPEDLIRGRDPGGLDGAYGVLAQQRYRAGETKPLISEQLDAVENASGTGEGGDQ